MKMYRYVVSALIGIAAPALATVTVSSPVNNSTVSSPVNFVASASTACASGVAAMGIYVNNSLVYHVSASSLNTSLAMSPGLDYAVVQEWDNCGGATSTGVTFTVPGGSSQNGVVVSSPANNSTVSSPVKFAATGGSTTCAKGIGAMGIYINNALVYQSSGSTLSANLAEPGGTYYAVVQQWDNCGGASSTGVTFTVPGGSTLNGVSITSPAPNSTVSSPVTFTATAGSTSCAKGVAAMGIYQNGSLIYQVNGSQMNTQLAMNAGAQSVSVQEWDNCGGAMASPDSFTVATVPKVTITANPPSIAAGSSSTITVTATSASKVTLSGSDGSSYTLTATGGNQVVSPTVTTTYTATATGISGTGSASTSVSVVASGSTNAINHVVFMLQENHSFDNYFGMLNPYRQANGWDIGADGKTYTIDGIDDKLSTITNQNDEGATFAPFKFATTCVDDETSAWLESEGDVYRWDFSTTRPITMDGYVHTQEAFAKNCAAAGGTGCAGVFTDLQGKRAMGYYDQKYLNYYYYMASQFAVSDRWFSPMAANSIPNRIATFTGGTTQGLVFDPAIDKQPQLNIANIFQELDASKVSWKIYYTVTQGSCLDAADCAGGPAAYPATIFGYLSYSFKYMYLNPSKAACVAPTVASSAVGDTTNSFCIDPNHIASLSQYYTDVANGTLPSFAFIEAGYGRNDEHPGSGGEILVGQQEVAKVVNSLMTSPSWKDSVFFLSYDEGGGPFDHVPPVPGHSNDMTDASLGPIPDIAQMAVKPDQYGPCLPPTAGQPTLHCDLVTADPGGHSTDAAAQNGFAAQIGFRVPNMIISPFVRKHYVSHTPMDHTAIIKFVENRFIGPSANLTARDAAQPNLLEFFDFSSIPWSTPPSPPAPVSDQSLGYNSCTPSSM